MKETYCLFLPADVAIIEEFIQQMFKAGACFDRDYKVTPDCIVTPNVNLVKVSTESQQQFNTIRRTIAQVLTKGMQ
jgi:hypothetical protein